MMILCIWFVIILNILYIINGKYSPNVIINFLTSKLINVQLTQSDIISKTMNLIIINFCEQCTSIFYICVHDHKSQYFRWRAPSIGHLIVAESFMFSPFFFYHSWSAVFEKREISFSFTSLSFSLTLSFTRTRRSKCSAVGSGQGGAHQPLHAANPLHYAFLRESSPCL